MRKIINSTYITLDGVIENPQLWPSVGGNDDRAGAIQTELLLACDDLIMGRRTYESFAPAWNSRGGDPLSDRMNTMRKHVVSSTLTNPEWGNTVVIPVASAVGEIKRLKSEPGGNIIQYGVGPLTYALLEHDMVDELRLWIHPLFLGEAEPSDLMFRKSTARVFDLDDVTTLTNGIVIVTYTAKN